MADWKKFASNNKLDFGLSAAGAVVDIASGKGVVKSIGKGLVDYAIWDTVGALVGGPAMAIYAGVQVLGLGAGIAINVGKEKADKIHRVAPGYGKIGSGFTDNQQAFTMRQRGLQAMGGHQGMVNNALGSEARRRSSSIRY